MIIHILGFFAILIPLTYMADHGNSKEVFTQFLNLGGFPSQGLSFFVGIAGCIFAFAGGDAAVHVGVFVLSTPTNHPYELKLTTP